MHKTRGNGLLRPLKRRLTKRAEQRRDERLWRRYLAGQARKAAEQYVVEVEP